MSSAAPTRENSRSTAPILARARRHEASHLREDGDERVLAQIGRFPRHVRSGEQVDAAFTRRARGGERSQSLATKGPPSAASICSTTGCRPALDDELERAIDLRPHKVAARRRARRARRATSSTASASAAALDRGRRCRDAAARSSNAASSMPSARSAALAILASSSPSSVVVKRTWPARVWRWMKVALSGAARSLSPCCAVTSTKYPSTLLCRIFSARTAGRLGIARLQRGDDPARFVAQRARLVERAVVARAHEAAVALEVGKLVGKRGRELGRERADQAGATLCRLRQLLRHAGRSFASSAAIAAAARMPSRMAARSRGPPRSTTSRAKRAQEIGRGFEPRAQVGRAGSHPLTR